MHVIVKFLAEMRKIFKTKEIVLDFESDHVIMKDILKRLLKIESGNANASRLIVKPMPEDFREFNIDVINPALLVMVNDVDFRLVGGVDALIANNDTITLLPTIHGG